MGARSSGRDKREKPTDDMADSFMETTSDSSRPLPAGSELVAPTAPPC